MRNVVKFNWATELMIYIEGDIGGDLVYKNGFMTTKNSDEVNRTTTG